MAVFPVTAYLWAAYGRSLEERLRGVPGVISAVYARAVRNCPWVGLLWARCVRPPIQTTMWDAMTAHFFLLEANFCKCESPDVPRVCHVYGCAEQYWQHPRHHVVSNASGRWSRAVARGAQVDIVNQCKIFRTGRWLRALERGGAAEEEHGARYAEALAAGLQAEEDYLAVHLARADALRRRGPPALPALRATFQCADPLRALMSLSPVPNQYTPCMQKYGFYRIFVVYLHNGRT